MLFLIKTIQKENFCNSCINSCHKFPDFYFWITKENSGIGIRIFKRFLIKILLFLLGHFFVFFFGSGKKSLYPIFFTRVCLYPHFNSQIVNFLKRHGSSLLTMIRSVVECIIKESI